MQLEELISNFDFLDSWEDKYRYIIELGEKLPPMPQTDKIEDWKVEGCTSQVWLKPIVENNQISFLADSDALIVKGILQIVLTIFSSPTIKNLDIEIIFDKLGLREHLSPSRRNGLFAMVEKISTYTRNFNEHS